ncbi:putative alcohol dehydrogenase [Colletotrichum kahawae]|uniref:Alcohol dehydrogenase n=1 Tax=Colletotrichum kahawae TaxID=34407 RepID=A0AAD9YRS4_COLKA|nr:putative alcohol dehydrogenase [Colletotrichum kahawae]
MAYPETYQSFRRTLGDLPQSVEAASETLPKNLGSNDVVIKIHTVSLNFRDVGILYGRYPAKSIDGGIIASDCAAEVVAVGSTVKDFKLGDYVVPIFSLMTSMITLTMMLQHLEEMPKVFFEIYLLQASTLACAGVTAWNVLDLPSDASEKNMSVLLQGTGGVSMFSLLLCIAAGVQPIITSSSDCHGLEPGRDLRLCRSSYRDPAPPDPLFYRGTPPSPTTPSPLQLRIVNRRHLYVEQAWGPAPYTDQKIAAIKKLHPSVQGINYKTTPNVAAEVRRITNGRGVDVVVNNTGPASIIDDLDALRQKNGHVSLVGFLDGFKAEWDQSAILGFMNKRASLRGIRVGSKKDYIQLFDFLEKHQIALTPLVDRVFPFSESREACDYLYSGKHVGKVVIKI